MGFYLIPIIFIAIAVYMKTKSPVIVSAFLMLSGMLFSGASMFANYPEMFYIYSMVTVLGMIGLIVSIIYIYKK